MTVGLCYHKAAVGIIGQNLSRGLRAPERIHPTGQLRTFFVRKVEHSGVGYALTNGHLDHYYLTCSFRLSRLLAWAMYTKRFLFWALSSPPIDKKAAHRSSKTDRIARKCYYSIRRCRCPDTKEFWTGHFILPGSCLSSTVIGACFARCTNYGGKF